MIVQVLKRDGTYQDFNIDKIADAIYKAAVACNGSNYDTSMELAKKVVDAMAAMCQLLSRFKTQ